MPRTRSKATRPPLHWLGVAVTAWCAAGVVACEADGVSSESLAAPVMPPAMQEAPATPLPPIFAEVRANGTGCPEGTTNTRISDDRLAFTTTFSKYAAEIDPSRTVSIKDCQLGISLRTPSNMSFSVQTFSYTGYANLDEGVTGRQTASYYFMGNPAAIAESNRTLLIGPYDDGYVFKDEVKAEDRVWSPCGITRDLQVRTRLQLLNSTPPRSGVMNVSTFEGAVKMVVLLEARRCPDSGPIIGSKPDAGMPPAPNPDGGTPATPDAGPTTTPSADAGSPGIDPGLAQSRPTEVRVSPARVAAGQTFSVRWRPAADADATTTYRVQLQDSEGPIWESPATRLLIATYPGEVLPLGRYQVVVIARTNNRLAISDPVPVEILPADGQVPPVIPITPPPITPPPITPNPTPVSPETLARQCDAGTLASCFELGLAYEAGERVTRDIPRAFSLFKRTCEGGLFDGCVKLGDYYYEGLGTPRNYAQAVATYTRACDAGNMEGCDRWGRLFSLGHGVAQNHSRAAALFKRACEGGSPSGCSNLGMAYAIGSGVAQDYARAAMAFATACNGNVFTACTQLGGYYEVGVGVAADPPRAVELFTRACNGGALLGCVRLASCYQRGVGVERDIAKALELLRGACTAGNSSACAEANRLQGLPG